MATLQENHSSQRPTGLVEKNGMLCYLNSSIWVPDDADNMQLRLCIIAHTGLSGHHGRHYTETVLTKFFFWFALFADVRSFVSACIHCLSTVEEERVPCPFGPAVYKAKPNGLLQFHYINQGPSTDRAKYVLMLRDDNSDYKWFFPAADTSAEHAAQVPRGLMSDGPTNLKTNTVWRITKRLKVLHDFTLPYYP